MVTKSSNCASLQQKKAAQNPQRGVTSFCVFQCTESITDFKSLKQLTACCQSKLKWNQTFVYQKLYIHFF